MELISCPVCGTKNAAYRFACVKCGVELFDPTGGDLSVSNASKQKEVTPSLSPPPQPQAATGDQPAQAPPSIVSFLQEILSEKQRVDREVEAATQEYERQAEEQLSEVHEITKHLGQFARDNKLDKALIALWEEISHYPSRSQGEDFGKLNKLELADVAGSRKENIESVEFTYAGQRFMLSARRDHDIVGDSYMELSFYEDGTEVFAIRCSPYTKYGWTDYLCDDVSAFKNRGSWARVLLGLYGRIQIDRNKSSADAKELVAKHIKSRFEE